MKIKHLFVGMLALAAAVACKEDQPVETPKLDVSKSAVSLAATAAEASFDVTTNQDWTASVDADWVSVDPATGKASSKAVSVKVTAEDNESTDARSATVTVKAGELTKTVKVTQAAGAGEQPGPGDEPELPQSEWALVGTFGESNNWNPASDLYLSVLDEEYFVYYGFELTATTEFKFLKGGAWPSSDNDAKEIGGNGLVEPNTIQPAGGSNIKVTEAGKYDIYLAADLTKFYIMSEGKLPSEATEPAPVENQWGMMGCFVDNQWGSDVPMTKEGEWIVAKGAQFTELTFKIRANSSWADATNIGVAPGSERGVVNGKISVVTAEYSKANLGGDAADIKLNGEAGTYDVYFSFENLEVYVMEQGFKPGEKEPQNPDPVEITYTVVGTLKDINWSNNAPEGLMVKEGDYYVGKNIPLVTAKTLYQGADQIEFKVVETGTWDGYAHAQKENENYINGEIPVVAGGENIIVKGDEGNYDVYFDKTNEKVWVMTAGYKPGDDVPTPEPEPSYEKVSGTEVTEWGADAMAALFAQYGKDEVTEDFVYEKLYFSVGGGKFKFGENSNAAGEKVARFQFGGKGNYEDGKNIVKFFVPGPGTLKVEGISSGDAARPLMVAIDGTVTSEAGYELPDKTQTPIVVEVDCSAAVDGSEIAVWSGNSGLNIFSIKWIPAGVTEPEPEPELDVDVDGKQWTFSWESMGLTAVIDLGVTEAGTILVAYDMSAIGPTASSWFVLYDGKFTVAKTDGATGVLDLTLRDIYNGGELSGVIPYVATAADAVTFDTSAFASVLGEDSISATQSAELIEIDYSSEEGFADGDYWIMSNGKVATPLTGSYGYLQTIDAEGGKSYASNAFTFTCVDATEMLYAIQDSNGKYLYQTGTYNSFNVSEKFDTADDGYYWSVIAMGDGTYYIANYNTMKTMQYDSGYGSFGCYDEMKGVYPELVLAEDPIAEPEPDDPSTTYTKIESVADLSAGTYYMAAYLTTDSNGTDLSSHPYHLCTGVSTDLYTASYAYTDGSLVVKEESTFLPVDVVLEAVEGKENTYAIKISGKYLYSTEYSNRKLASGDTPVEWVATDNANGGVTMTTTLSEGTISMGSASATSKFIRSYKNESTLKYGLVFFKKN